MKPAAGELENRCAVDDAALGEEEIDDDVTVAAMMNLGNFSSSDDSITSAVINLPRHDWNA